MVGGSGSGKTRFFIKPNLMQCHSSYVVTDPKGSILIECGKLLQREGYRIKVLNTINFQKSMRYNPFAYLHSEQDILKLVTALIANTKGEGRAGDDFWVKAETLLYTALIAYIHYEAPVENQNFSALIDMLAPWKSGKRTRASKTMWIICLRSWNASSPATLPSVNTGNSSWRPEALSAGDKVKLVDFGSFEVRTRSARTARNPRTGEKIEIGEAKTPIFKAGKALKDSVNK